MNPAISLNKNELRKRFEDSGMASDQVELAMKVFEDNNVPLIISFPFKEFISISYLFSVKFYIDHLLLYCSREKIVIHQILLKLQE